MDIEVKLDAIGKEVVRKVDAKYKAGMIEHGEGVRGMSDAGLSRLEWLLALQEEAIDTVAYCEVLIQQEQK